MTQRPKVIVLGGAHSGLAVVRSLAKHNIDILVLTYNPEEPGLSSRFVKQWEEIPHPDNEQAFIDSLLQRADDWQGALILETNDYFARILTRNKDVLTPHFKLVTPDLDTALTFLEKDRTYRLADTAGVPHPKIADPQDMSALEAVIDTLEFPVMVKPVDSVAFVTKFGQKAFLSDTPEELREDFARTLDADLRVVISEIIPGTDYKTLERVHVYINSKGDLAAAFGHVKLRQTPPMYGVMRVGKSTPPNKEVADLALNLLKAIDYHGFASVEFKRDYRDNQLKLMEVNLRLPRSLPLPVKAGVDFPYLIFQDLVNDNQIIIDHYHEATYLVEIIADIADFVRRDPDRNIVKFLQPYFSRHTSFAYLWFTDPMPFVQEIRWRLRRATNKFLRRKN